MAISPRMMKVNPARHCSFPMVFWCELFPVALIPVMSPLFLDFCVLRPVPTSRFRKVVPDQHKNQPWICDKPGMVFTINLFLNHETSRRLPRSMSSGWLNLSLYHAEIQGPGGFQLPQFADSEVGIGMIRKEPRLAGTNFRIASVTWPCSKILRIEWKKSTKTSHFKITTACQYSAILCG